jgi:uncharacterized protein YqeY
MTSLKDQLKADLTINLKAHNQLETMVLRAVIGEIQTQEKGGKTAVVFDDAKVLELVAREAKKRRDTAVEWAEAGVLDRATRESAEADFLAQYLPTPLTEAEVEKAVADALAAFEAPTMRDFGAIMKIVVAATKGRADGKTVSALVKAGLS